MYLIDWHFQKISAAGLIENLHAKLRSVVAAVVVVAEPSQTRKAGFAGKNIGIHRTMTYQIIGIMPDVLGEHEKTEMKT